MIFFCFYQENSVNFSGKSCSILIFRGLTCDFFKVCIFLIVFPFLKGRQTRLSNSQKIMVTENGILTFGLFPSSVLYIVKRKVNSITEQQKSKGHEKRKY